RLQQRSLALEFLRLDLGERRNALHILRRQILNRSRSRAAGFDPANPNFHLGRDAARRVLDGASPVSTDHALFLFSHYCRVRLSSSRFTVSLTTLPSPRMPFAANFAITAFITPPISFMLGADGYSPITPRTVSTTCSSPADCGK